MDENGIEVHDVDCNLELIEDIFKRITKIIAEWQVCAVEWGQELCKIKSASILPESNITKGHEKSLRSTLQWINPIILEVTGILGKECLQEDIKGRMSSFQCAWDLTNKLNVELECKLSAKNLEEE